MVVTVDVIRAAVGAVNPVPLDESALVSAGVLMPLHVKNGELCVALTKRSEEVEHHKGEISFPGGVRDDSDKSILDTALRETYEEIGVAQDHIEIVGRLDHVSTRTGFAITPFVGFIPSDYAFEVSETEVAEILNIPIDLLLDPNHRRDETSDDPSNRQYSYLYKDHIVWGATARMLTQFLRLLDREFDQE